MQKDSVRCWRKPQVHILDTLVYSLVLGVSFFGRQTIALNPFPFQPPTPEVLAAEGLNITNVFQGYSAAVSGSAISQSGWGVTVDSYQPGNPPGNAIDGNANTFWHTEWTPSEAPLPHTITIDMKTSYNVGGLTYQPRQDGNSNGNIGRHQIFTSTDGNNWQLVAFGTFYDDSTTKSAIWETLPARYVQIKALSEAGNRGPWTSAAEINIYQAASYTPTPNGIGKWGPTINFPTVPVAASMETHSWSVLTWSSYAYDTFTGNSGGQTYTATYNPYTQSVSEVLVTNTQHDMFCPGVSLDFSGRTVVTGGNNAQKTSIYDPNSNQWISGSNMQISRGYQASCTLSDGRIFTIGGSWSGGQGGKNGEVYNPATNTWTLLPSCPVAPMLTNDAQGVYRADNHAWLFGWKNECLFQAGPSKTMNWYCATGNGGQLSVGTRNNDPDSMCGNAVMYDAVNGKILTMGGSPNYQGSYATTNAHIITIVNPGWTPTVQTVSNMAYQRIFANAVVLPNGEVFVTGGQTLGNPFSDDNAILTPEMWNPATETFTKMAPNSIPRTYHSFALLMLDGTVLSGGGGLCGTCSTNHFDAQIYTPQYLLNANGSPATRPTINYMSSNTVRVGGSLVFGANSAISSASFIRYGSATHTVDTDQRRMTVGFTANGGNRYTVTIPSDPGIALPGIWMLFAMNGNGVPAVAQTVQITL
jgi:galactose oxidase